MAIIGLADQDGGPVPKGYVEGMFLEIRALQIGRPPAATFRIQRGFYGGRWEDSLEIEVWPEADEDLTVLAGRVRSAIGKLLRETNQDAAAMRIWDDGLLVAFEEVSRG